MNLKAVTCDEFFLLQTFKDEYFIKGENWEDFSEGDFVCLIIFKKLSAFLKVSSIEEEKVFIQFLNIIDIEERPILIGKLRDAFLSDSSENLDEILFYAKSLPPSGAKFITEEFDKLPNALHIYFTEIDYYYEEALKEINKRPKEKEEDVIKNKLLYNESDKPKSDSIHSKTQHYLKELAKITQCDTWMASNDQNRDYLGDRLGDDTLSNFPNFDIDPEAKKRVALIDTLWFQNDQPVCAFEAEITSSVYSGILRMADLITVIPNLKTKLYIVAPLSRKDKVLKELSRPIFVHIGLTDYCKFVPLEHLETLFQKVKGLDGYISYDVIDAISISAHKENFAS